MVVTYYGVSLIR